MEFEVLKDLVRIITRNKIKNIEVLGNPGSEDTKTEELYNKIASGEFQTDEQATEYFYGTDENRDKSYKKLRNRLIRQLINTAFFVDVNQPLFNERSKAIYNCYRDFASAQILSLRDARQASVYLMHQTLEQCIKYEFIELAAEITRFLRLRYSRSVGDKQNHAYFSKLHKEYELKRATEMMAMDYYDNLIDYYINKKSPNSAVLELARTYYETLLPLADQVNTAQFYFYTYIIGIIRYMADNDGAAALLLSNEALTVLQARRNTNRGSLLSIVLQKLEILTLLRQFDEVEMAATYQYCLQLVEPSDFNWFKVHEVFFQLYLYAKEYDKALEIYALVIKNDRFITLQGNIRDVWRLYAGYLHLLATFKVLQEARVMEILGEFKLVRFFNDFEVFDRDKEGMNIPLVLLPLLFSLAEKDDLEGYGRSIEAIEKYRKRYLDNEMNRRSASFTKMLLALGKIRYEKGSAERKIKKEMAVLDSLPPQDASQSLAVEIIPYEDLWALLIQ